MSISLRKLGLCNTEQQATGRLTAVADLVWGSAAVWCCWKLIRWTVYAHMRQERTLRRVQWSYGCIKSIGDAVRRYMHVHNVRLAGRSNQIIYVGLSAGGTGQAVTVQLPHYHLSPHSCQPAAPQCAVNIQPWGRGMARKLDLSCCNFDESLQ